MQVVQKQQSMRKLKKKERKKEKQKMKIETQRVFSLLPLVAINAPRGSFLLISLWSLPTRWGLGGFIFNLYTKASLIPQYPFVDSCFPDMIISYGFVINIVEAMT